MGQQRQPASKPGPSCLASHFNLIHVDPSRSL
jgi:hypothetical protein